MYSAYVPGGMVMGTLEKEFLEMGLGTEQIIKSFSCFNARVSSLILLTVR